MISKELLVVMEFDEVKLVDEFDFSVVPIWMRVECLPLGLVNRAATRVIGVMLESSWRWMRMEVTWQWAEICVSRSGWISVNLSVGAS